MTHVRKDKLLQFMRAVFSKVLTMRVLAKRSLGSTLQFIYNRDVQEPNKGQTPKDLS